MKQYEPLIKIQDDKDVALSIILDEGHIVCGPLMDEFVLYEAVINIEVEKNEIQNILINFLNKHLNKSINELIPNIENLLKNYKIKFKYINSNDYDPNTNIIYSILTNKVFLVDKNFDSFINQFISLIGHELIHRYEAIKINNNEITNRLLKRPYNERKKYFGSKYETMAYAWQIVNNFRTLGKKDKNIKILLQAQNDIKFKFGGGILVLYHKLFTINDEELKLLYKYMYMYLDE
jgi:hypothetical protein